MSVYVDDMRAPYGRMIMCHMIADTVDELLRMADFIGVRRKWLQTKGRITHFDVCRAKKRLAIEAGAIELDRREYVRKMRAVE